MTFGQKLRMMRASRNLSAAELGRRVLLGASTIRGLERDEFHPTWSALVYLAWGMGVSLSELLCGVDQNPKHVNPHGGRSKKQRSVFGRAVRKGT